MSRRGLPWGRGPSDCGSAATAQPDSEGLSRKLAIAARHLVPDGAPLWAQIAPANAASVRAFVAAGFTPVGAGALLVTD
jgi:hypothetical protein